jgi:hypothetical protein
MDRTEVIGWTRYLCDSLRRSQAKTLAFLVAAAYREQEFFRSQNSLEYGLLRALRAMVPAGTDVLLLADRGFGRAQMASYGRDRYLYLEAPAHGESTCRRRGSIATHGT